MRRAFWGLGLFCGCSENPQGEFYTLQEAYDNGWLTKDDLMSIAYYNNGGREGNEDIMAVDYLPIPKSPETLEKTTDTGKAIIQTFFNDEFSDGNPENISLEDVGFRYYGCYNNCIAVRMGFDDYPYSDVEVITEIEGVFLIYSSVYSILNDNVKIWIQK